MDDYIRLLKRANGGWPARMMMETTARWVQFETEAKTNFNVILQLFMGADERRLDGIDTIMWPIFGRSHCAVLVIRVRERTIEVLDSIPACARNWELAFLQKLLKRAFGWKNEARVAYPKCRNQGNNDDCGVYAMGHVRSLIEGVDINDARMPGVHLKRKKDGAVVGLRKHFARELRSG